MKKHQHKFKHYQDGYIRIQGERKKFFLIPNIKFYCETCNESRYSYEMALSEVEQI